LGVVSGLLEINNWLCLLLVHVQFHGLVSTCAVSWVSKKHVFLSFVEVECRKTTKGACETVWLRDILRDFMLEQAKTTMCFCDNQVLIN